uniref:BPTI/Kunitz inhibitor domain-containing protein n=1 Tax=Acrobeloides nanus TaxID=290746 RepID=A0A914CEW4_9BILA
MPSGFSIPSLLKEPLENFSFLIHDDEDHRPTFLTSSCRLGTPCSQCSNWYNENDVCDTELQLPIYYCNANGAIEYNDGAYYICNAIRKLEVHYCPKGMFFKPEIGCMDPSKVQYHQAAVTGSGRVGDVCSFNTDCLSVSYKIMGGIQGNVLFWWAVYMPEHLYSPRILLLRNGMYCSGGLCTCLSTYILRESYCYEKINPNQPGCTYDVQCASVWPNSKCNVDAGIGTCRCPATHVARETRDGWVCVSLKDQGTGGTSPLYFICPLPEGAGFKIALNDPSPQFGTFPVACTTGSAATVEPVSGLHGGAACIWPSTNEFIGDIYDCIHTSPNVKLQKQFPQSLYSPTADGVCCPTRALACIQPQVTGPNPTEPRWWFNSVTGTCQQFLWDATATQSQYHSPNNFRTIDHCESYCRDTCSRGSPQYTVEAVTQVFTERPLTGCTTSITCANDYQCTTIGSQHMCCPTPAVICSHKGGRPQDLHTRSSVFHTGFQVNTGKETTRFYYDPSTGKCQDFV